MYLRATASSTSHAADKHDERLLAGVKAAVSEALCSGRATVLRGLIPLPDCDPLADVGPRALLAEAPFLWEDGRGGAALVAWGALETFESAGEDRFAPMAANCSRVGEHVLDWRTGERLAGGAALALGGFAFAASLTRPEPWQGWPDACVRLPRCLVTRPHANAEAALVVSTLVRGGDDPATITERLGRELGQARGLVESGAKLRAAAPAPLLSPVHLEDAASFRARVAEAARAARDAQLDKVVLARSARFDAPAGRVFDAAQTLLRLRAAQPQSICFAVGHAGGVFLGATPEVLLRLRDGEIETHAVAGTTRRGATPQEDAELARALLASFKDRGEHDIVTNELHRALAERCAALEVAGEPRLLRLPQVQHLETTFRGRLREPAHLFELAATLHPTPSVGGFPARAAWRYLTEHEPMERGWYAAPLGWVDAKGEGTLVVAIRSVLLRGGTAWAFAGAGIVGDSDPEAEWRETELKLSTASSALALSESGA